MINKKNIIKSFLSGIILLPFITFCQNDNSKVVATQGTMTFTVKTASNNGDYSPRHVLAIWIKNSSGAFVKSRKVMGAARRSHLIAWNSSSSGNTVDATTGATINNHTTHTITWDCKDVNGNVVPDGDYKVFIEFTESNSGGSTPGGPTYSVSFTKGTTQQNISPADQTYFKNMSLTYTPVGVNLNNEEEYVNNFIISPNPCYNETNLIIERKDNSIVKIIISDNKGKVVKNIDNLNLLSGKNIINWEIEDDKNNKLQPGLYFITVKTDNYTETKKCLIIK